jgi:hypothetical protein
MAGQVYARPGWARQDKARSGKVRQGKSRQGEDFIYQFLRVGAGLGAVW